MSNSFFHTHFHARRMGFLAVLIGVVAAQPRVSAQTPELEVFYSKLEPKEQFKYKWKGKEGVVNAGVFRWEVPQKEFGTNGLDRNFTGYCAEVLVPITADKLYRFQVNSLYAPEDYGLAGKEGAALAAQRRATYIKELFGRYFHDPVLKAVNAEEAIALQVALWEVIQESEPEQGAPKLDLFSGDFQANYPKAEAPAFVLKAQQYLDSLTGSDAAFYENPDLRGRELIRLNGIPNAAGVVAQSQYALRYAGGGGAGAGGSGALLGGGAGGLLGGGFGGPLGGIGSGLGGGGAGGLVAGTGGGGSGSGTSFPGAATTPGGSAATSPIGAPGSSVPPGSAVTVPPVNSPPSGTPPINTPTPPPINGPGPTPVPAPAALLLGAIALGTIGSWRLGVRLLAAK